MLKIEMFKKGEIPDCIADMGIKFIQRRFSEEWGVHRNDINRERLVGRINIVGHNDRGEISAWLGVSEENELVNGCVEKGHNGVFVLKKLIAIAISTVGLPVHAFVPLSRLGSAVACITAGQKTEIYNKKTSLSYSGKSIYLVKITLLQEEMDIDNSEKEILMNKLRSL